MCVCVCVCVRARACVCVCGNQLPNLLGVSRYRPNIPRGTCVCVLYLVRLEVGWVCMDVRVYTNLAPFYLSRGEVDT